jgi:hypothetical protein
MRKAIAAIALIVALSLSLITGAPAVAATYKNDYIPKRSDSFRHHIGHMENESKQRARAGAEWVRTHNRSPF